MYASHIAIILHGSILYFTILLIFMKKLGEKTNQCERLVISFMLLREVGRSQSQRGVKHRVEIDDFQFVAVRAGMTLT